jgi:hypothetical protein
MKEIKKVNLKLTLSFLCEEDEWNKMVDETKNNLEIHLRNFVENYINHGPFENPEYDEFALLKEIKIDYKVEEIN